VSVSFIAVAQEDASEQANRIAIRGTVLDSAGKPVSGALVRLEREGSPSAAASTKSLRDNFLCEDRICQADDSP